MFKRKGRQYTEKERLERGFIAATPYKGAIKSYEDADMEIASAEIVAYEVPMGGPITYTREERQYLERAKERNLRYERERANRGS